MPTQQHGSWSDDDEDFEDDRSNDSTAMRELRKADRAKAKRIAELEGLLAERSQADRSRAVKDVLQARNLNPKIAGLIPSDVEPTEEALGKWLDDYGDLFGATPAPRQTADDQEEAEHQRTLAQMRQMDDMSDSAGGAGNSDMGAQIAAANSREELEALLFGGGAAGR